MTHPLLVVDAANVVGSVPDGWWRDRAGATARLRDALVEVAEHGLPDLPGPLEVVLVVEGRARHVESVPGVRVVPAPASGDDTIVEVVRANPPDRPCTVVTADRALRDRVTALNATVLGPRSVRRP
ncbi:NTP pyrophosphohydrolase [Actinosynnema sp. NPDC091369]